MNEVCRQIYEFQRQNKYDRKVLNPLAQFQMAKPAQRNRATFSDKSRKTLDLEELQRQEKIKTEKKAVNTLMAKPGDLDLMVRTLK